MPRDGLATIPQPQAPLETLLQAFYKGPEQKWSLFMFVFVPLFQACKLQFWPL